MIVTFSLLLNPCVFKFVLYLILLHSSVTYLKLLKEIELSALVFNHCMQGINYCIYFTGNPKALPNFNHHCVTSFFLLLSYGRHLLSFSSDKIELYLYDNGLLFVSLNLSSDYTIRVSLSFLC